MNSRRTMRRNWTRRNLLGAAAAAVGTLVLCFAASVATAQVSSYGDKQAGSGGDKPPTILGGVGIDQRLNTQLPLNLAFTDDAGQPVKLASYFGKSPAI